MEYTGRLRGYLQKSGSRTLYFFPLRSNPSRQYWVGGQDYLCNRHGGWNAVSSWSTMGPQFCLRGRPTPVLFLDHLWRCHLVGSNRHSCNIQCGKLWLVHYRPHKPPSLLLPEKLKHPVAGPCKCPLRVTWRRLQIQPSDRQWRVSPRVPI